MNRVAKIIWMITSGADGGQSVDGECHASLDALMDAPNTFCIAGWAGEVRFTDKKSRLDRLGGARRW